MTLRLEYTDMAGYMGRISNYSFFATMIVLMNMCNMTHVIKNVTRNHTLAQSMSPISLGMNLIWNFFFFAINFQFTIQGERERMVDLAMPTFWYFICTFTFESRLFILVWRAQLSSEQSSNQQYQRKILTCFYIAFYVTCFSAVVFQRVLLYDTWAILLFNSTFWIPQIVHTYILRTRKGPNMALALGLTAMQSFMPLYLKIDSTNFLDQESDPVSASFIIIVMALQLFIMRRQQTHGARWFIPKRLRLAYEPVPFSYYH